LFVAHEAQVLGAPPGQWSREQISEKIRKICVDVLECEKIYREDADFVKALGLS
jgi:23S rRNA U2552 (ribose-2'-O)-methylase RlmE/FtsJ